MTTTNAEAGETFTMAGHELTVAPKCDDDAGGWLCTTHDLGFRSALALDEHSDEPGPHRIAWLCYRHGPEVP